MIGPSRHERRRRFGHAVLRALLGYLVLTWVLIKLAGLDGGATRLLAAAVLIGFPVVVLVTGLLHRYRHGRMLGGWAVAGLAILAAGVIPLGCMTLHAERPDFAEAALPELVPAALTDRQDAMRLRLRIQGLTLLAGRELQRDGAAVLLLHTDLDRRAERPELVVTVELREGSGGPIHWRDQYRVAADDLEAVHEVVRRALDAAMRYTREGVAAPRLV